METTVRLDFVRNCKARNGYVIAYSNEGGRLKGSDTSTVVFCLVCELVALRKLVMKSSLNSVLNVVFALW